MALNVGQDFKKRWLNTPEAVRQTYQEDLARICDLLLPHTFTQTWLHQEQQAQQLSEQRIAQHVVDEMVAGLSSLMEPIIIVFLGTLIGGIVVSMYLPIFKLGQVV